MKRLFSATLYTLALVSLFSSCKQEVDDIFSESSAARIERAIKEGTQQLQNAPNGWVMEYFANPESEGYTFFMEFGNKSVNIGTRNKYTNNEYKEEVSLWEVIGDNGPVLTFNSYNNLFHIFSNPQSPDMNPDLSGVGLKGDYEFVILERSDDYFLLKGKKRGTYINLTRLEEGRTGEELLSSLYAVDTYMFSTLVDKMSLDANGEKFILKNGNSHIFDAYPEGGDPIVDTEKYPFIVTEAGIRFCNKLKFGDVEVQEFRLNADKTKLVSVESGLFTINPPAITAYLNETTSKYWTEKDKMGDGFATLYAEMEEEFKTQYKGRRDLSAVGFMKKKEGFCFILKTASNEAVFTLPYSIDSDNQLTIKTFDAENMDNSLMDNNAKLFYNAISSLKTFLAAIQGSYIVTTDTPFLLNSIKYSKENNESQSLTVSR